MDFIVCKLSSSSGSNTLKACVSFGFFGKFSKSCGAVMGGDADSSGAGDDLVSKV